MKIKAPRLLALFAYFLLAGTSFAGTEWIIELQQSDDLNSWNVLPVETEILQDGRLRVLGGEPSGFFRIHLRTPGDVATEKALAYIAADGIDAPVPTVQDYRDLAVGEVDPGDLTELNAHLLEFQGEPDELPAYIRAKIDLLSMDPVALDYAQRTGLANEQRARLSSFLVEIKEAGINPVWLVLGRSEFQALQESVCRAVIGPDGIVMGGVQSSADGIGFDGIGGTRIEFPNPAKAAAVIDFSVWCHGSHDEATRRGVLVSAYRGTADRGPELTYGGAPGMTLLEDQVSGYVSPGNTQTTNRFSAMPQRIAGVKKMSGWSFAGTAPEMVTGASGNLRPFHIHKDLYTLSATNETPEFYNDGNIWSLGARPDGGNELLGEIDLAMACGHPLTTAQRDQLHAAALKHGIVSTTKPLALIAVGDSMTAGQAGGVSIGVARTAQLMARQTSGWKGGIYTNEAKSGQPIEVQEGFYATAKERLLRFDGTDIDRYIMFWGGYNSTAPGSEDPAVRNALVDRYIEMGIDARDNGIQTIHWSYLMGASTTTSEANAANAFNDYYAQRCAQEGLLWYDHRITFAAGEFDGASRNEDFFVDGRHLSELGQATLVADFISRFPAPPDSGSE